MRAFYLSFISGIPEIAYGKILLPKVLHRIDEGKSHTRWDYILMNSWFSLHMCVFWGTQTSCCVFWTSRDFMMRWVNCIKVRLVCLNSVVVSGYCCLTLVMLLHGCLRVGELMEAQEDIQVTSDLLLVSWRQLFKLFQVSEDLTVEIVFQSTVNSNPCLIVAEKIIYKGNYPCYFFLLKEFSLIVLPVPHVLPGYSRWKLK